MPFLAARSATIALRALRRVLIAGLEQARQQSQPRLLGAQLQQALLDRRGRCRRWPPSRRRDSSASAVCLGPLVGERLEQVGVALARLAACRPPVPRRAGRRAARPCRPDRRGPPGARAAGTGCRRARGCSCGRPPSARAPRRRGRCSRSPSARRRRATRSRTRAARRGTARSSSCSGPRRCAAARPRSGSSTSGSGNSGKSRTLWCHRRQV